jgi:hypothetical protein
LQAPDEEARVGALVRQEGGSVSIRLPALSDETDTDRSAVANGAAPEPCSRPNAHPRIPANCTKGSGNRRADPLRTYHARGILSLSEKQTKACFSFVANFEGWRGSM